MGASVTAGIYLGILVTEEDLLQQVEHTEVLCDHEQAQGNRFCPVCGRPEDERRVTRTRTSLASKLASLLPSHMDPDMGIDVIHLHNPAFYGFRIYEIEGRPTDETVFVYGAHLGEINAFSGYGHHPHRILLGDLADKAITLKQSADELGFPDRIEIITGLSVSF